MGGKMLQQSTSIQDSADILQRNIQLKNMIEKFAGDDASYAHVVANNIKKINNNEKVVAVSVLSSSFDEETGGEHTFSCNSCPRKFSSQQAMAGHRNTHRNEWEPIKLEDIPNHDKIQHRELLCYQSIPTPSLCAPQYPLAKPMNILKRSPIYAPQYPLSNRTNTDKGPSTYVRQYCMVKANPTIGLNGPTLGYTLAKANPTTALERPTHGCTLAKANPTTALERPTHGYTLDKANPTIAIKGTTPGYLLATSNSTIAFKKPTHVYPLSKANPTSSLKWPSPKYHMVKAITTNTLKRASPGYQLRNIPNILIGPPVPGRQYIFSKPTNSILGSSLGVAHYASFPLANTLNIPSTWEKNNYLGKGAILHGKSTLGVKHESMIHKPCQAKLGQNDTWLRGGSTPLGKKQMIGSKTRHIGIKNNNVGLKYVSTSGSSASEGRGNSEAHGLSSSSFQPVNGKGKKPHAFFAPSPIKETHNHDDHHSSQGLIMQCDGNGENDSFLNVDLDLKL